MRIHRSRERLTANRMMRVRKLHQHITNKSTSNPGHIVEGVATQLPETEANVMFTTEERTPVDSGMTLMAAKVKFGQGRDLVLRYSVVSYEN